MGIVLLLLLNFKFLTYRYIIYIDQIWDLTTVEEGYTYVASEGAAKLSRLSSTRYIFICSNYCLFY
jgi:hypothetical protein